MRYTTLDTLVRSALMQRGYSLHWYLQALKAGSDCLRELTFDTLKNVRTVSLPVDGNGVAELPCDYVDWVRVGVATSQYVRPLVQKSTISPLQNLNSTGQVIPYQQDSLINYDNPYGFYNGYWFGNGFDSNYEWLGRWFGFNAGQIQDGFQVFRERGQVQLDQAAGANFIVFEYISDGQSSDDATQIHPYAQKTIEAYIFWQFKEHNRSVGEGEKERARGLWVKEHSRLRARLNPLTKDDIVRIVRKSYSASIKG